MSEENPEVVIQSSAVADAQAASAAESARTAEESAERVAQAADMKIAQVTQQAAEEIREHEETVEKIEDEQEWTRKTLTEIQTGLATMATATASSLEVLSQRITSVESKVESLTPPPVPQVEAIAETEVNPGDVEESQGPKTLQPQKRRKLI